MAADLRGRGQAPAHLEELAAVLPIADYWRHLVREDGGQGRDVAGAVLTDVERLTHGRLGGVRAIEIAHRLTLPSRHATGLIRSLWLLQTVQASHSVQADVYG